MLWCELDARSHLKVLVWSGLLNNVFTIPMARQREAPMHHPRIPTITCVIWLKLYWTSIMIITIFPRFNPTPPFTQHMHTCLCNTYFSFCRILHMNSKILWASTGCMRTIRLIIILTSQQRRTKLMMSIYSLLKWCV